MCKPNFREDSVYVAIFDASIVTSRGRCGFTAAGSTAEAMHCGCTMAKPWQHTVTSLWWHLTTASGHSDF